MESALMEVRAALSTTTNNNFAAGTIAGGAEIQKLVQEMAINAFNNVTDVAKLLPRKNISQLAYIWNIVAETSAGTGVANSSFTFYSEGGTSAPVATTKVQQYATAKGYRTDYEVTGLMIAAGMGNQLLEEAKFAAEALAIGEEKQIICGTNSSAYGNASGFYGLNQLMSSYVVFNTTLNKYGIACASSKTYLDCGLVNAGGSASSTATNPLSLAMLDSAITVSNKRGGKGHRRIFLCSEERGDAIEQLIQVQQKFVTTGSSIEFDGGIRVLAYKYIPIIRSRFMDKNGVVFSSTNATWANHCSNTDAAMYLLDLEHLFMVHVAGVNAVHVPVAAAGNSYSYESRGDVQGGFFKSYGVLVMDRFDSHVLIHNLTTL